jgi:hypothetical protein
MMAAMAKTALAAICIFTLLATAYLTASLLILRPPRANYQQWTLVAAVILVQGALTLFALRAGSPKGLRYAAAAGGAAIAALGASSIYSTVTGPHFEGYALVLGSMLVVQGLLTLIAFAGSPAGTVAQLRE